MKKEVIGVSFIFLMIISLSFINAEEDLKEEIKEKFDDLDINDYRYQYNPSGFITDTRTIGKTFERFGKFPNYYKTTSFKLEEGIGSIDICYADRWRAEGIVGGKIRKVNYNGIIDFFKRLFGMGPCKRQVQTGLEVITPMRFIDKYRGYVTENSEGEQVRIKTSEEIYKDAIFEKTIFEGKDVIKVTILGDILRDGSEHREYYYDWESLLLLSEVFQCGQDIQYLPYCSFSGERIIVTKYTNISINTGMSINDFEIPEGDISCEIDYDLALNLSKKSDQIEDIMRERKLTEQEYNDYLTNLRRLGEVYCGEFIHPLVKNQELYSCTYEHYFQGVFPECVDLDSNSCKRLLLKQGKMQLVFGLGQEDVCVDKTPVECFNFWESGEVEFGLGLKHSLGYEEYGCYNFPSRFF